MQISLINGYYIEVSNRNFTLRQKYVGTSKEGNKKEYSKIISHCGSLEQALDLFLRINQVPKEAKMSVDLMEYANYIEQSNKEAVQALKSVLDGNHDDVCEWRCDVYGRWHTKCHTLADNDPLEYKYCPYCGKKIKVVGD